METQIFGILIDIVKSVIGDLIVEFIKDRKDTKSKKDVESDVRKQLIEKFDKLEQHQKQVTELVNNVMSEIKNLSEQKKLLKFSESEIKLEGPINYSCVKEELNYRFRILEEAIAERRKVLEPIPSDWEKYTDAQPTTLDFEKKILASPPSDWITVTPEKPKTILEQRLEKMNQNIEERRKK